EFRFAVMGAGKIAVKFCDAVQRIPGCRVAAVSSKSMERANEFAQKHGIPAAYGSYVEMLEREKPDCVYIAVTPHAHYDLCMLCLDHGTPILCEKAMFLNSMQAETVFSRAAQQRVFVMEAMWSRFLPANRIARQWLCDGLIGDPVLVDVGIGFVAPPDAENRYRNPELGGGVAYDLTVYAYELATFFIDQPVRHVQVEALWSRSGIDETEQVTLRFDTAMASLRTTFAAAMEDRLVVYGTKGRIVVPFPHFASEAFLYDEKKQQVRHFQDQETKNGFVYELQETIDCIGKGRIESDVVPHALTIDCSKVFDRIQQTKDG
ncbi:MAG TPA: Gfo/Idh/MocA family oxidoreductase, partial [Clostridia bacterium]|nr:Gfo/Idh/MocA family oxidoreductase [Clostridia bacterium]